MKTDIMYTQPEYWMYRDGMAVSIDDAEGNHPFIKKDSFFWYRKFIESNGAELD